jgi:3-dehydroquinate synthase
MKRIILMSNGRAVASAAGKSVAEWLGSHYLDYEQELERRARRPISVAQVALGSRALREMEDDLMDDLARTDDLVLSAPPIAAGSVLTDRPAEIFLLMEAPAKRDHERPGSRKLRASRTALVAAGSRLRKARVRIHSLTVPRQTSPGALAYRILSTLDQPAPRIFPNEIHPVLLASDGYGHLLSWLKSQGGTSPDQVVLVIPDDIPRAELRRLRNIHHTAGYVPVSSVLRVPSSDRSRTSDTLIRLWRSVGRVPGLNKKDILIGLGPRNVMHLTAALAATTLGGLRLVLVPGTLASMIESGSGFSGALRVRSSDLPLHFNYFPIVTLIDPLRLLLSSEDDLRAGYLEIIRIALIGDPVLFDRIDQWSREGRPFAHRFGEISWVLERALRIKIRLLEQDTPGTDRALHLRLGEPFYSALLAASRSTYSGAPAGASALALALAFSRSVGALQLRAEDRVFALLKRLGLPASVPDFIAFDDFYDALKKDPYAGRDQLTLPLPTAVGSVSLFQTPLASFKPALSRVWSSLLPSARA